MSIESKGYLATPADITALARTILAGRNASTGGADTYLKALHANTVAELNVPPRANAKKTGVKKLKSDQIATHLAALEVVHSRFYEAVVIGVSENLPPGKEKALELNRRTNFARSAVSTVRSYIRAGNDITALVSARVVKSALAVPRTVKPASPKRLRSRIEKQSKTLMTLVIALGEADKVAAIGELETLMGQLAAQREDLGGKSVSNPRQAVAEHKPLRTKGGSLFIPVTRTQVIRQQARPS